MSRLTCLWLVVLAATVSACAGTQHGTTPTAAIPDAAVHFRVAATSTAPAVFSAFQSVSGSGNHGFKTIYTFTGGADGGGVQARMTNLGGTLYGTAHGGGASGNGAVFTVDPETGAEKAIYSFERGSDGWGPEALLNDYGGTLYGTTSSVPEPGFPDGEGNGTVFAITTTGAEHVLHSFTGSPDGANPEGFVLNVNGTLYGTTFVGGTGSCSYSSSPGCGTVFTVDPETGAENVIYSFTGGSDGAGPRAGLSEIDGTLYGTTYFGGASDNGTVFSITRTGTEHVIYSFRSGGDGSHPQAALLSINGILYGTTNGGGSGGTVFSVTTKGAEHVISSVCCGPEGGLTFYNGKLYGTTSGDGSPTGGSVFSLTLAGSEHVLHNFTGGPNGGSPEAALTEIDGTLFGTTRLAGASGVGTVFRINP